MENRFLALGKFMVIILALFSPVFFWKSYSNQRELLVRDASVRKSMSEEANTMTQRMTYSFFNNSRMLRDARLTRTLPDGAIEGLSPFPDAERFRAQSGILIDETPNVNPILYTMLWDSGSFFSGMPKRYAGLVEILRLAHPTLSAGDYKRAYEVASELYKGLGLKGDDFGYLIERMPEKMRGLFMDQWHFLGYQTLENQGYQVMIRVQQTEYLLELDESGLERLNQVLQAFDLDTSFVPADRWMDWGDIRFTLEPQQAPSSRPMRKAALVYTGTGLGIELVLLMLYLVLVKYEKMNLAQKKLLATTSHELRTPLAVIRQFSEMLMDRQSHVPERFRPWHRFIHRESMKMQFLVENLLSAARFEHFAFRPDPTSIDLRQWIEEIVDSIARLSEDHEIRLECPQSKVSWDASLMSQVLVNILENARIHAGTDIDVIVKSLGERVEIEVRDYGNEISINDVSKIEAFKSVEGRKTGLGLGLYLVRRIVNAHGGELRFEQAGPGLRVLVSMPRRVAKPSVDR